MTWIQTYTGKAFDLLNPNPDDICIEDIAHALSQLCRYTGHTRFFYSVAHHSILASFLVEDEKNAKAALLHDASEAYLSDIATPAKQLIPQYYDLEDRIMRAIAKRFDFEYPLNKDIKNTDARLLQTERMQLLGKEPKSWGFTAESYPVTIVEMQIPFIKALFLTRMKELT